MHPRGVTLIELLIAIALLLVLAAIATPLTVNTLDERAFESALDSIERQLLLARAEAQLRGEIIEVVAVTAPGRAGTRLTVRRFNDDTVFAEPIVETSPSPVEADLRVDAGSDMAFGTALEIEVSSDVLAVRDLPPRMEIRLTAPDPSTSAEALTDALAEMLPDQRPIEREDRLLLYVPDGSALLARRFWVVDDENRQARVEIVPWTGQPRVTRLPPADLAVSEELDGVTLDAGPRAPLEFDP